jgi:hypothetical protein
VILLSFSKGFPSLYHVGFVCSLFIEHLRCRFKPSFRLSSITNSCWNASGIPKFFKAMARKLLFQILINIYLIGHGDLDFLPKNQESSRYLANCHEPHELLSYKWPL